MDPDRVVAGGHGLGRVPHLPQGGRQPAGEEVGDAKRHNQGQGHGNPSAPLHLEQEPGHDEGDGGRNDDQDAQFHLQ